MQVAAGPVKRAVVRSPLVATQSPHGHLRRNVKSGSIINYVQGLGAAALCGVLLWSQPVQAAPLPHLVLLDGNAAIMGDLKKLTKTRERFRTKEPTAVLSTRFVGAQQQLQRIELLVKIEQYDNARMQLREGSFKTLRMDLGYGQEMYRVVKENAVREVVEGIERLDGALKRRESVEAIKPQLATLQAQLADLAGLMASLGQ